MDPLLDVMRASQISGGVFMKAEFSEPWCMVGQASPEVTRRLLSAAAHVICYHYVVEGRMRVRVGQEDPLELHTGDLVLFPHNDRHLLGSDLSVTPVAGEKIIAPPEEGGLYTIHHGGRGALTNVICGFLGCEEGSTNPVISALPSVITLTIEETGAAEWIRSTFQFAAQEVESRHPGAEAVLAKLSEIVFIEAVRRYAEGLPEGRTGWLAGLRDRYVARALALLHGDIARDWTVEELCGAVGLSRSAFAERFTRLLGVAPKHYLANWRMQIAARKLRTSNLSLIQIARDVGYESDAAFSRAFKKAHGEAPAAWRRKAQV